MDRPLRLLDLPNEILSYILEFCDSVPPSLLTAKSLPIPPQVHPEATTPLKKSSILNHRLRKLALPLLFRHLSVSPDRMAIIIPFTSHHNLDPHVTTAQVYLPGPTTHRRPHWWHILLSRYPRLSTLTITAPPSVFAEIIQPVKLSDQWAFKIPHQTIQLKCDPNPPLHTQLDTMSILHARPWNSYLVNEASLLLAYQTYEYFLRHTPSPIDPFPAPSILQLYQNLLTFTFVSIFPAYNHVAEVTGVVQQHMPNLECLTVKLLPDPSSTILQDTLETSGFHIDVNDPWNEFETSLNLIGAAAVGMSQPDEGVGGRLRELHVDDVQMMGVRDTIETTMTVLLTENLPVSLQWSYEGDGLWRRQAGADT